MHSPASPFAHSSGPRNARIAIVGEAWGEQEEAFGRPFIGTSGQELTKMLAEAGIERKDCFLTNVFALKPYENKVEHLCASRDETGGASHPFLNLGKKGKYLKPEYWPEVSRLKEELETVSPNLIVAMGATASWALLNSNGIGSIRGAIATSTLCPGLKVLPTYHPAGVLRNWSWRTIVIADLMKALRNSETKALIRPERYILVEPTLDELISWIKTHNALERDLAVDIETNRGQIEMIGFAVSPQHAAVFPFFDQTKPDWSYWPALWQEVAAWKLVKDLLEGPGVKIFQNGMYDLMYLVRFGFRPRNCFEDTMLKHHALYPELQKGLGFLGSIYTNEPAWKLMRKAKMTETKSDD
jgi:uracil-DNA glycosylase